MKEQILGLIRRHNETIDALRSYMYPIPEGKFFTAMTIWHKLACEGSDITHIARGNDIDAKCNMQTGEIYINGEIYIHDEIENPA